jgi:DNA-directed RNA polymerase subunit beta'
MNNFDRIRIGLASPEKLREWSFGEVRKPETINYRTLKPERDGLFCEKIFGPIKDWECHCGKYKRIRFKGIKCDKCGVEVTRAKVRRERMGHIELATPVSHIWYFKGVPSRIGLLLDMSPRSLEKIIYFAAYVVIDPGGTQLSTKKLLSEMEYREAREKYGQDFKAATGAEAIKELLAEIELEKLYEELKLDVKTLSGQKRIKAIKRLEVVEAFRRSGNKPDWMILEVVPVIPPELRPMVQLDGGRFATSDLNDLYRRVINRNNRLKRLLDLGAPEIIVKNEKRMLQEAVDALIDNGRRGRPVTGPNNRPLKSLSDMLKGKQGRFRQNLLGKRVDYSGRSVIVVGPNLKLHQCGLPKEMALELFKPFVMKKLVDRGLVPNIKGAKKMVERVRPEVWDVLEEVIKDHPVLLNRAPTLHRLGIQAFEPILVEGKAIQIHPLVCTPYNADFDGDQMAVHLPLSVGAQAEARVLMLSSNNLLLPAYGKPAMVPTQDMVLGCYYLTLMKEDAENAKGKGKNFSGDEEALIAYNEGLVDLQAKIEVRIPSRPGLPEDSEECEKVKTTVGRLIFNRAIKEAFKEAFKGDENRKISIPFRNELFNKSALERLVLECQQKYGNYITAKLLDSLKEVGFRFATRSGLTIGIDDIEVPPQKQAILDDADEKVKKEDYYFDMGLATDEERYRKIIEIWNSATESVADAMIRNMHSLNPIRMMAYSGARGNVSQVKQLAGMRGLMADPSGKIIPLPIRSNLREGHSVLEYFISTHGARKGLADTALRTADSGYLTRRLVDVAQDVIVREEDCGTADSICVRPLKDGSQIIVSMKERISGRVLAEDIYEPGPKDAEVVEKERKAKDRKGRRKSGEPQGKLLARAGDILDDEKAEAIMKAGIESVRIRSILTCKSSHGVCSRCYGKNLATGQMVEIGETVGIIAAQSIGEPGTQLTLRTFHYGGLAVEDIISGLPRVEELFEARKPKGHASLAEIEGIVQLGEEKDNRKIAIRSTSGEEKVYLVPIGTRLKVRQGDHIEAGTKLTEGSLNPHDVLRIQGKAAVYEYLVNEVQNVYRSQGVDINDKHIEVIARQMLKKVKVDEAGDTDFLPGSMLDSSVFAEANEKVIADGGNPATAKDFLLGVTKASLATDSFLSAASFQETTKVLTEAAINGKIDFLRGLKENVIIGKLIPAGTGLPTYREVDIRISEEEARKLEERARIEESQRAEEMVRFEEAREDLELSMAASKMISAWRDEATADAAREKEEILTRARAPGRKEVEEEEEEIEVVEEIIEEVVEEVEEGELLEGQEYVIRKEYIEVETAAAPSTETTPAVPLPEKQVPKRAKEDKSKKAKKGAAPEGKRLEKPKSVKEKKVAQRLKVLEDEDEEV